MQGVNPFGSQQSMFSRLLLGGKKGDFECNQCIKTRSRCKQAEPLFKGLLLFVVLLKQPSGFPRSPINTKQAKWEQASQRHTEQTGGNSFLLRRVE